MTDEEIRDSYRARFPLVQKWLETIYARAITEALFASYIKLPYPHDVPMIVGYDPQKLLPSPETIRPLTTREWADAFVRLMTVEAQAYLSEPLTLWPEPRTGRYIPSIDWNKLYGDDGPELNLHRPRERTYEHKLAILRAGYSADWTGVELRALAHDPRIRGIVIDIDSLGGLVGGDDRRWPICEALPPDKPVVSTAAGKRDMSYLKHDPSKRHRRRR